jgi:hypothetical protein
MGARYGTIIEECDEACHSGASTSAHGLPRAGTSFREPPKAFQPRRAQPAVSAKDTLNIRLGRRRKPHRRFELAPLAQRLIVVFRAGKAVGSLPEGYLLGGYSCDIS